MNFADQYKSPHWQKLRLQVLEAGQWRCANCRDTEKQLHVHHKRYIKGRKIWEYEVSELEVQCVDCHAEAHDQKDLIMQMMADLPSNQWCGVMCVLFGFYAPFLSRETTDAFCSSMLDEHAYYAGTIARLVEQLGLDAMVVLSRQLEALVDEYGGIADPCDVRILVTTQKGSEDA